MPIPNYSAPQSTISQFLEIVTPGAGDRRNALVIGAQYQIRRYVKGTTPASLGVAYNDAGVTLLLPDLEDDAKLDAGFTKLFAEGLRLKVATVTASGSLHFSPDDLAEPSRISLYTAANNSTVGAVAGSGLNAAFDGRSVQVGDYIKLTGNAQSVLRKVVAVLGAPTAASADADATDAASNPAEHATTSVAKVAGTAALAVAIVSGDFSDVRRPMVSGFYGDRISVSVVTPGAPGVAQVRVTSASGLFSFTSDTVDASGDFSLATAIGGLTVKLSGVATLAVGNVITFDIRTAYDKLPCAVGGLFTGTANTTYVVRVTTGGAPGVAKAIISDTAGIEVVSQVTLTTSAIPLGAHGLTVTFDDPATAAQGAFLAGDAYTVTAVAAGRSSTTFSTLVLDGPAYAAETFAGTTATSDIALSAEVHTSYTGEILAKQAADFTVNFATGALATDGIAVRAGLELPVAGLAAGWAPAVSGTGKLFVTARGLIPPALGETYFKVQSDADVLRYLGLPDVDNDLGFAVSRALSAAKGKDTYFIRVASDDEAGYAAALALAVNQDIFYAKTTTADAKITRSVVQTHVNALAAPKSKKWSMGILPITSPGSYGVLTGNHLCEVSAYQGANRRLRSEGALFTSLNLRAGDLVRINYGVDGWGDETYDTFAITDVPSDDEIILKTGLSAPTSAPVRFEIWKADTADNVADYLVAQAAAASDRRITLVWCDSPLRIDASGNYAVLPVSAIAAEIAGVRAYSLPHQGLTKYAVSSVAAAPTMHSRFTTEQLDRIGAAGIFIVTQDTVGGTIYVRHQLTTDVNRGVLYSEQSVTSNMDDISYKFKDVIDSYTGKWNATPSTLNIIRNRGNQKLLDLSLKVDDEQLGPQIVGFDDGSGNKGTMYLGFSPVNRDRYIAKFRAGMPVPLNGIDLYEFGVEIDANSGTIIG